jgi:predicted small secreted protein
MVIRILALAAITACVAGCNTMHGVGQDFNSVFAPSKNTSDRTILGSPTAASGADGSSATSASASSSTSGK